MRANKSNYITYNAHFNDRLNALRFKRKNMNDFTAKMNDADLKICVTHSTYYIPHVRFYSMAFSVMYPKVFELLDLINNRMVELTGNQIGTGYYPCLYSLAGHIMQPKRFQQWKVAESDDEAYIEKIVQEMCDVAENLAMPLFERYSKLENVMNDLMHNEMKLGYEWEALPPIVYTIFDRKDLARDYLQKRLQKIIDFNEQNDGKAQHVIEKHNFYIKAFEEVLRE